MSATSPLELSLTEFRQSTGSQDFAGVIVPRADCQTPKRHFMLSCLSLRLPAACSQVAHPVGLVVDPGPGICTCETPASVNSQGRSCLICAPAEMKSSHCRKAGVKRNLGVVASATLLHLAWGSRPHSSLCCWVSAEDEHSACHGKLV